MKIVLKITELFNKIEPRLIIFLILCIKYLSFNLSGNEEQYFAVAKQFYDPNWIPNSFILTEWGGARLVYNYIVGFALNYLTFEELAFWGRIGNYILLSYPLARLFRYLKISNIEILLILLVIYLPKQTFFAHEWIFGGFESKTISYAFLFYGLYYLLKERYKKSVIFTVVSTYLHVLVGGWFFLITILYLFLKRKPIKSILILCLIFAGLISPYAYYLAQEILLNTSSVIDGINLDWIYVYYRTPHHVAPFKSASYFNFMLPGILYSLSWYLVCLFVFRYSDDNQIKKLNHLNIVIFSLIFISLIISYFDKTGIYLKYYPFRSSALTKFLIILQVALFIKSISIDKKHLKILNTIILIVLIPMIINSARPQYRRITNPSVYRDMDKLAEYVNNNTKPDDKFIFVGYSGFSKIINISFLRKTKRDRFVAHKIVPSGGEKIYEWYVRIQDKKKVESNFRHVFKLKENYQIDYIVSQQIYNHNRLKKIHDWGKYKLYRIQ